MSFKQLNSGKLFLASSLVMLFFGLIMGSLASLSYVLPNYLKDTIGFVSLRPMHVSSVLFWIILGASGCIYSGLEYVSEQKPSKTLATIQWALWLVAIVGIFYSYFTKQFGGREYWEFNPIWALPIIGAWVVFLFNFFRCTRVLKKWPVYMWMWMTGMIFFLFTFIENYLWVFPYFRTHFITDMTIQWKVNGSLVGSWNQIIYGTAFFLMDRISGNKKAGFSKLAFGMYFLGLFNLMFNWGHHIYTLPTLPYVRYMGYGVSMTEWIIFARIFYTWRVSVSDVQKHYHYFPFRFLFAADAWVFFNLGQALLMSIPAINIYTHGTHVTVAHAMGTTIGINSMILLAACFEFFSGKCSSFNKANVGLSIAFWGAQVSLFAFWIALNAAGIKKGIWQMASVQIPYGKMMQSLHPYFVVFAIAGFFLLISITILVFVLLRSYVRCELRSVNEINAPLPNSITSSTIKL
ncbi:MAG: cbb3-type cytochrome c oxidase subunit I [bacterium]|nr:cbb3-type cytochrome c oxidase subunit I [bacterium]